MFKDLKEIMIIEVKEAAMTMSHQIESVSKDIEIIFKKNKMEMLELRSIITKMKHSLVENEKIIHRMGENFCKSHI